MDTKKLRQKILDLAIRGKLVPQDPNDEPASVLLERIRAEKEQLIKEGKIKRAKKSAASDTSHYENVPFDVPDGWCWTTLGEIGNWQAGATPSRMQKDYYGGKIPWLKTGDLTDGYIYDIPETITDKALDETSVKLNPSGSVLIAMYGATIGKVGILTCPATTNQAWCACVGYKAVTQKYLFYFLLSHKEEFVKMGGGGAQPNISKEKITATLIPIPPIAEQNRITNEVEHLIALIESIEFNRAKLDQSIRRCKDSILDLATSGKLVTQDSSDEPALELLKRINPSFEPCDNRHYENVPYKVPETWQWVKLKDLCVFLSRGKSPVYSETDKRYPVFAQKCNLKEGGISLKEARFLEPRTISKWKDVYKLQDGDILVNSTGTGTVCRTRLFRSEYLCDYPFVVPDSHVSVIRTDRLISSEYAYLVLVSKFSQTYMMDNLAGSTNQKELYISVLENLLFPLPPADEQKRIVKCVNEIYMQLEQISSEL